MQSHRAEAQKQNIEFEKIQEMDREKEEIRKATILSTKSIETHNKTIISNARAEALKRFNELNSEPEKGVQIAIRMPDGRRVIRKFSPDASLQVLYVLNLIQCLNLKAVIDWVTGLIAQRLDDDTFLDDDSPPPQSSEGVIPFTFDKYQLVQSFPKAIFDSQKANLSLKEVGLTSQVMLVLEKK